MKVYYDKDADLSLIKGKKVTIVGYGSQGHAHALNLHDSGMKVTVGLRKSGASWDKAKKAGLKVLEVGEAVKSADFVMMLMPDEHIAETYIKEVEPNIKKNATLAFAHGFNIHYGQVAPRADLDAIDRELALYSPVLAKKPQVIAVTKMDVPEAKERFEALKKSFARRKKKPLILAISAVTGEGIDPLLDAVAKALRGEDPAVARLAKKKVGKPRGKAAR